MSRTPIKEEDRKQNFNAKLHPDHISKLKLICSYRTVTKKVKKYSEASFVEDALDAIKPKKPTAKQIAAYNLQFPDRPFGVVKPPEPEQPEKAE